MRWDGRAYWALGTRSVTMHGRSDAECRVPWSTLAWASSVDDDMRPSYHVRMPNEAPFSRQCEFKSCRRDNTPGDAHSLTFSCFRRQPLLARKRTRGWMVDAINAASGKYDFAVWAFVIMPEHVHILLLPRQPEYSVSRILSGLKQPVSKQATQFLRATETATPATMLDVQPNGRRSVRFWQRGGGYDRNLRSPRHIWETIDYIHANPVRRGLCEADVDWPWSSAEDYHGGAPCPVALDLASIPDDPRGLNAP